MKTCHKCGLVKPAQEWGRHQTFCLACLRAYTRRKYREGVPHPRQYPVETKVCPTCGETKSRVEFGEKGEGHVVRDRCRPCAATYEKDRREASDSDVRKAAKRAYELTHRHKRREHASRRRARLRGVQSDPVDYKAIIERDGLICGICKGTVMPDDVHIDHIIPLAAGGPHSPTNLQVTHSLCNLRKHARVDRAVHL